MDTRKRQSGLSLLEVLIAIAVLGIGLLGLASMQSFGLLNVEKAYQRSQATVLAYAVADKMRAHVGQGRPADKTLNLSRYRSSFMAPEDAEAKPNCKTTTGCSADDMAENDLYEWNQELATHLPAATGAITITSDDYYTVAITWDDNGDGTVDSDDPSFEMSFLPHEPEPPEVVTP